MSKKPRPPIPELPECEMRPDDNGTGSAIQLAEGESPHVDVGGLITTAEPSVPARQELEYRCGGAAEQYAYAVELYRAGKPYVMACPTNLPTGTLRGRAMLLNAMQPGDVKLKPGESLRLRCRWWVIVPDRIANRQSGEVEEVTRTCLITDRGEVYRTTSEYAPQRAAAMNEAFTPEEMAAGIPLVITAKPSTTYPGSTWHDIRVDMEALPNG